MKRFLRRNRLPMAAFSAPRVAAFATFAMTAAIVAPAVRADVITGKVTGKDGAPVAGATVYVTIPETMEAYPIKLKPKVLQAVTAADGSYRFDLEPMPASAEASAAKAPAMYGIAAVVAPGYALIQHVLFADETKNVIPLRATTSLSGTIAGKDSSTTAEKPIAGATIQVKYWYLTKEQGGEDPNSAQFLAPMIFPDTLPPELVSRLSVTSDSAGKWQFDGLPVGGTVALEYPGTDTFTQVNAEATLPNPGKASTAKIAAAPVHMVTQMSGAVTGTAIGPDGKPLAGVMVYANHVPPQPESIPEAVSGPDGVFVIKGISPGKVQLIYRMQTDEQADTGSKSKPESADDPPLFPEPGDSKEEIAVTAGKTATTKKPLKMLRTVRMDGKVIEDGTGKGVPNVSVMVYDNSSDRVWQDWQKMYGKSAADGSYHVFLPPGRRVTISADPTGDDYVLTGDSQTQITAPDSADPAAQPLKPVTFKVTRAWTFTGNVTDAKGNPVKNVHVRLVPASQSDWDWDNNDPNREKTDATGKWKAGGLERQDEGYIVRVDPEWEVISPARTVPLTMEANTFRKDNVAVVVKRRTTQSIAGSVADTAGKPLPGAEVNLQIRRPGKDGSYYSEGSATRNTRLTSDSAGHFSLNNIALDENVIVSSYLPGYRYSSGGLVEKGGDGLRVTPVVMVKLASQVRGHVIDSHGKPVAGARVWSIDGDGAAQTLSDSSGAFTVVSLPAGSVSVTVAKGKQYAEKADVPTFPVDGATAASLVLKLPAAVPAAASVASDQEATSALLKTIVDEQQGKKGVDRSNLIAVLARTDPDTALALAKSIHPNGEAVPDGVIANIVEARIKTDPVAAAKWAWPLLKVMAEPMVRIRIACELGIALAPRSDGSAAACYALIRGDTELPNAAVDINRARLVALSALLHNGDEAGHLKKLLAAVGGKDKEDDRARCAVIVARGDIPAAESMVAGLSPDNRANFYEALARRNARTMPAAARGYVAKAVEGLSGGGISNDWWLLKRITEDALRIIDALGPRDPAGALAVARLIPEKAELQPVVLASAARFQTPAVAAPLWKAARQWAAANDWDSAGKLAKIADLASRDAGNVSPATADSNAEQAKAFWQASLAAAVRQSFQMNEVENWVTTALRFEPAAARMALERSYASSGNQPPGQSGHWQMSRMAAAMGYVDLRRALSMVDELPAPDPAALRQNGGEDTETPAARLALYRLYTLPQERRLNVTLNALYGWNGEDIDD